MMDDIFYFFLNGNVCVCTCMHAQTHAHIENREHASGGWWDFNWGERSCGNGWSGIVVEWYQIHQTHGFQVLDAIPFTPLRPLL